MHATKNKPKYAYAMCRSIQKLNEGFALKKLSLIAVDIPAIWTADIETVRIPPQDVNFRRSSSPLLHLSSPF